MLDLVGSHFRDVGPKWDLKSWIVAGFPGEREAEQILRIEIPVRLP